MEYLRSLPVNDGRELGGQNHGTKLDHAGLERNQDSRVRWLAFDIHNQPTKGFFEELFLFFIRSVCFCNCKLALFGALYVGRDPDTIVLVCICNCRRCLVDDVVQRIQFRYNVRLRDGVSFVCKDPSRFKLLLCQAEFFLGTIEFELQLFDALL